MSYFENASHFSIREAHFMNHTGMLALQYLHQFVARGASHDSKDQYEAPKCDPETRTQLLSDILEWIKVPDKETGIVFMHRPAGAGKSCIAQSVCEQAASGGLLGASFFFWRGSSNRNNESRQYILTGLEDNPRIVDMLLETQFRKLIFEPCSRVPRERLLIRAINIDGLDKCIGEVVQIIILRLLAKAVRYEGFPFGIFITSCPKFHMKEVLDTKEIILLQILSSWTALTIDRAAKGEKTRNRKFRSFVDPSGTLMYLHQGERYQPLPPPLDHHHITTTTTHLPRLQLRHTVLAKKMNFEGAQRYK
ncbi:hypothetical protein BDQ17DRAFT_1407674 [Cyathus striatus]|nr:hypothetical protein BDQ17DRAFT_1407674 [Cyathus striatus]